MISGAKLKHSPLHLVGAVRICEPALWAVVITIFSERILITLYNPGITSHKSAPGDQVPADSGSRRWHDTFDVHPESGVHAECFLNASVEIGQLTGFRESGLEVG